MTYRCIAIGCGLQVAVTAALMAQSSISGVVRDSAGAPIAGAQVAIAAVSRSTESNGSGAFVLNDVPPGVRLLSVRRIGFTPFSKLVQVREGDVQLGDIVMLRVVTQLDTVVTRENELWREAPLLREFEENRKIGLGKFYTREDLERDRGRNMITFFEALPGLRAVTATAGGARWIASARARSISNDCVTLEDAASTVPANARCTLCFPLVYLDFQLLSTHNTVPNINRFRPDDLEAIEVYRGGAQTPARYSGLNSQCGVVVLHSRRPTGKKGK